MMNYIEIVTTVGMVVFGFIATYFKANKKLTEKTADFINEAEEKYQGYTKAGQAKFNYVVDSLYKLLPTAIKPFITKHLIAILVQNIYETMENYATKQLDKLLEKEEKEEKAEV